MQKILHINLQTYGSTNKVNKSVEDFKCFTDNGIVVLTLVL